MVITIDDIRLECYSKLLRFSWRIRKRARGNLYELGFARNQYSVLKHIDEGEAITLSELSHRVSRGRSNITALVDSLEERELIRRIPDKSDRRVIRVELTEKGENVRAETIEAHEDFIRSMFKDIDDKEIHSLIELLETMDEKIGLSKF